MTNAEIEAQLTLAVQLSLSNSKNIEGLVEAQRSMGKRMDEMIKHQELAIARQDVADERLTRMELLVENYIKGLRNGGTKQG